ncbi:MAG: hypothetical protein H8M99_06740 [Gloeobacteraceae cyanobacterium ES-bin-144]|nr:hypothetical protein [Verrucomicrobiales bacterium]
MELLRRLVATMYADGLVGGSSACMMVGPEKNELHLWMCEHEVIPPLSCDECELERRNREE